MDWALEAIEVLRLLWAEGHSTAEIGRRMGISKNAVVGKAHRLNLSARPSPIRREEVRTASKPASVQRLPAPPRPMPESHVAVALPQQLLPPRIAEVLGPRLTLASQPAVRAFQRIGTRDCCWPIGEPGTTEFRFCTSIAVPGRPYCTEHAAVAYVKVRDRRDDAA